MIKTKNNRDARDGEEEEEEMQRVGATERKEIDRKVTNTLV